MSGVIVIHKGRMNELEVSLGFDVSADTITSEIRSLPDQESPLLATWTVDFVTDGTDGEILLSLAEGPSASVTANTGYMDLKRVSGGNAYAVFDAPLEVTFRGSVTA